MEWLSHSQKKYCELCKTPFRFTKLYKDTMPSKIPLFTFIHRVILHMLCAVGRWIRYAVVGVIWLCWLPWSIRQVWRGLFWLADGGWISENDMHSLLLDLGTGRNSSILSGSGLESGFNLSLLSLLPKTLPQVFTPIATFLGTATHELLAVKLFRIVFTSLGSSSSGTLFHNATLNAPLSTSLPQRYTFLSDLALVNSTSGIPVVDNAILDILEGQLVCLLVITAFILVFLIREWVINQQPMLNVHDHVRPDNLDANAPAGNNGHQQPPRLRRGIRHRADVLNQADVAGGGNRARFRPRAAVVPQRAATDENIGGRNRPSETPPVRAASFAASRTLDSHNNSDSTSMTSADTIENQDEPGLRPPPPLRGAPDDPIRIHRIIEENTVRPANPGVRDDAGNSSGIQAEVRQLNLDVQEQFREQSHLSKSLLPGPSSNLDPDDGIVQSVSTEGEESDSPRTRSHSWLIDDHEKVSTQNADPLDFLEYESVFAPFESSEHLISSGKVDENAEESADLVDSTPENPIVMTPVIPNTTIMDDGSDWGTIGDSETDASDDEDLITGAQSPTMWEPLINWLWDIDRNDQRPSEARHETLDVDDVTRSDQAREAHPVQPQLAVLPNPPPAVAEADVQHDWHANDIEAIEDAEDIDGILELIGIRGPIAGMIQNVIFSEFLITLTIAASLWLPYIWGKIALLILANPIGVFVRAPIYVLAKTADIVVDLLLFGSGLCGYAANWLLRSIGILPILLKLYPGPTQPLLAKTWTDMVRASSFRLEDTISRTITGLRPDLPTFSMQSRHALHVFRLWASNSVTAITESPYTMQAIFRSNMSVLPSGRQRISQLAYYLFSPSVLTKDLPMLWNKLKDLSHEATLQPMSGIEDVDTLALKWGTQDKVIAIILGYCFFALAGSIYMRSARFFQGAPMEEKVEGVVADGLRQAGGVMKVVLIIGIEMIVFPLYCGLLLDCALLPLFADGTVQSRIQFILEAPVTAVFIHWFIGTCYMFHFALFVSMCRKIFRRGVLYFIRDPDDPTFHPVRDVLERPVLTQLGKIAYSACIYGALVIMCLGGVVWAVSCIDGVFPIHWTTIEPKLAFPLDVIFYNFFLPFLVRKAEPSKRIQAMYEWWFRGCASGLRLTHFLFGEEKDEEKISPPRNLPLYFRSLFGDGTSQQSNSIGQDADRNTEDRDGTYVRAPANDSVRIPKGQNVFLEVTERNVRVDGKEDPDQGFHGHGNDKFTKVYIPSHFRARVVTFIVLLWLFTAFAGIVFTVGPLLLGRATIKWLTANNTPPNDLYALTVGMHICGGIAYVLNRGGKLTDRMRTKILSSFQNTKQTMSSITALVQYLLGMVYLATMFVVVLPIAVSLLAEVYIHIPVFDLLTLPDIVDLQNGLVRREAPTERPRPIEPTVVILQTWTLGFLYFRFVLRALLNYPNRHTRAAHAVRAILRDGWYRPNVRLATRAVILPVMTICTTLLVLPAAVASLLIRFLDVSAEAVWMRTLIYRTSYPVILGLGVVAYIGVLFRRKILDWRVQIRDEVYLVGEKLHNYQTTKPGSPVKRKKDKGKRIAMDANVEDDAGREGSPTWRATPTLNEDVKIIGDSSASASASRTVNVDVGVDMGGLTEPWS